MEKTKLQELGSTLNNVLMDGTNLHNARRLERINHEVYDAARRIAGVTASDLADETQENSPRVQHYWTMVSYLMAKVYMEAANQLSSFEGFDR